mmetsp:Transcript_12164/g.19861  ORF Transcript_12164/g.19861 Transcript_12164/m.19861 type:complete len:168 (+) Transcript_12164:78-581(+)
MSVGTVYRATVSPLYKLLHGEEDLTSNTMLLRMAYCLMWATISIFNLWVLYKNSTHVYASFLWDSSTVRMKMRGVIIWSFLYGLALGILAISIYAWYLHLKISKLDAEMEILKSSHTDYQRKSGNLMKAMKMIHAPMPLDKLVEKNFDAKSIFTESCGAQALDAKAR